VGLADVEQLDIRIKEILRKKSVTVESVDHLPHDLHVLLRHRLSDLEDVPPAWVDLVQVNAECGQRGFAGLDILVSDVPPGPSP
jgi:hypothetical protein